MRAGSTCVLHMDLSLFPIPVPIGPIRIPWPFSGGDGLPDVDAPKPPPIGFQGSDAARSTNRDRAAADYAGIQEHLILDGDDKLRARERAGDDDAPATAWPHGQLVAAALDRALVTGDVDEARKALAGLERFEHDGSYNPTEGHGKQARFYDDNAWIGLDYVQGFKLTGDQRYIDDARRTFDFLMEGKHQDGGVYWKEDEARMSRNTASNGPALQLALQLHEVTGEQRYLDEARKLDDAMTRELRREDGLYRDNVGDDGSRDEAIYSYNQGTPVGADLQMWKATGDQKYLDRAKQTARAAMDYFAQTDPDTGQSRLWKQPPAFNAIFFRNLMQLDRVAPDPRIRAMLESYLERARTTARGSDGLYGGQGIGVYEGDKGPGTPVIDQAAFVQMHALLAMTPEQLATVS